MALKDVKQVKNINWGTVGSVAVGIAFFGAVVYGIRKLPNNQVTVPVKDAVNAVS